MKTHKMLESKYLAKEDVGEDGTVVTVKGFDRVNMAQEGKPAEYKWVMHMREFDKPMVMNGTNIQLAEKALGSDDTDDWIGKQIIVYNDPNVAFGKDLVGGIRIRAHRKASPPREVADDFDMGPSAPTPAQVEIKEQEMRDAALNGMAALRLAWGGLKAEYADVLRPKLAALKAAAEKADAAPPRQAGDDFDEDVKQ